MSSDPRIQRSKSGSGRAAEDFVAQHLLSNGYRILERNCVMSRLGELDIVASKDGVICFVEVRSRRTSRLGAPAETVGARKQRKLRTLASLFLARRGLENPARFDVASVVWNGDTPILDYIEDAFV